MTNKAIMKLEELNLLDRFLFDETMENREAYQAAVSILLEDEIELLEKPETEKELRVSSKLRQVRLDVVSMDKDSRIYYTEMQQRDTGNLRKRSRYYQAQMDVSLLEPGSKDFNLLNDTCFILIAPFDLFGRDLYRYTFEGICRECPDLKIEDGAIRIFINTKGTNRQEFSQEFLDFMEYINATTDAVAEKTDSSRIKLIHENVRKIRTSEKMGVKYMQLWEEKAYIREDARAKGLAEGLAEGRTKGLAEGCAKGIEALILDNLEEGKNRETIIKKLVRHFSLTDEEAGSYFEKYKK